MVWWRPKVARGTAYAYGAFASRRFPLLFFGGPVLELARRYVQLDVFDSPGLEVDAVKSDEGTDRELHPGGYLAGSTEVDLRDFVRCHGAGVLDADLDVETAVSGFGRR